MSLLHYITYKLVVIRDKRVGSIYYTIAVLIVLYTLAEIFVKKGYLEVRYGFVLVLKNYITHTVEMIQKVLWKRTFGREIIEIFVEGIKRNYLGSLWEG